MGPVEQYILSNILYRDYYYVWLLLLTVIRGKSYNLCVLNTVHDISAVGQVTAESAVYNCTCSLYLSPAQLTYS